MRGVRMSATITQCEAILAILRTRPQGLTDMDALRGLGCRRLAARVWDLRAAGHNILTVTETRGGKTYARYKLAPVALPETEQPLWVRALARDLGVME
jgi:hypothetical protein